MGSNKEHSRLFPQLLDNKEPTVTTLGTDITLNFTASGTDTATTFYYNLGNSGAYHLSIRPSATVLITTLNGKTLTDPITVSTAGYTDTHTQLVSMVIQTTANNTTVKAFAKGGK